MKKIILPTLSILLSVLIIAIIPTEAEGAIYEDTVRLHILAASDSKEDQEIKYILRDMLLEKYGSSLSYSSSADEAKEAIKDLLPEIISDCNSWLNELGYQNTVSADFDLQWFDRRVYDGVTMPQGYYYSLIIKIGEGNGQNWWCVMYPPLCLNICTESYNDKYTDKEWKLITPSGYGVKFKILELCSELLK